MKVFRSMRTQITPSGVARVNTVQCLPGGVLAAVSEDKLIRLENLKIVMRDRQLEIADLMRDVGGRYSYWRDLIAGDKSFGEKAARKIEEKLKLPRGWLDSSEEERATPKVFTELDGEEGKLVADFRAIQRNTSSRVRTGFLQLVDDLCALPDDQRELALFRALEAVKAPPADPKKKPERKSSARGDSLPSAPRPPSPSKQTNKTPASTSGRKG